jgi:hypothetical protein
MQLVPSKANLHRECGSSGPGDFDRERRKGRLLRQVRPAYGRRGDISLPLLAPLGSSGFHLLLGGQWYHVRKLQLLLRDLSVVAGGQRPAFISIIVIVTIIDRGLGEGTGDPPGANARHAVQSARAGGRAFIDPRLPCRMR